MQLSAAYRLGALFLVWWWSWPASAQLYNADSLAISYAAVTDSAKQQQVDFRSLSLRAKLTWATEKEEQDFTGSIRLQKDSLVWASLSGPLGLEGFRVLVSPDSFKIINRLGNEYAIREFAYLERWLLFPLSFGILQQLLAGQMLDIPSRAEAIGTQDSLLVLYRENDTWLQQIWLHPQNYTVAKMLLKDKLLQQDMTITFDAYNVLNGKPFPYKRTVDVHRGAMGFHLQMEITRLTIDEPLSFPFEINERYTKVE